MRNAVRELFLTEGIEAFGVLPYAACRETYPTLLARRDPTFTPRSVLVFLVPYYTGPAENLSLYAVSRDYHLYMRTLAERLAATLATAYPTAKFLSFSDHSPIDERHAAASLGLGLLGDNGLLIHKKYGSLVFIGEVFSDLPAPPDAATIPPASCEHCGACRRACPTGALTGGGDCLSELTQRKGALPPEAFLLMRRHATVWGCDLCQTACPHTRRAIAANATTPIAFFHEARLPHLTLATLAAMSDEEFSERAYAWRGRKTIERNLTEYEKTP
ncbi:MAG: DUF1730 domain-containing protein [Clostridia bacterium]|nr:DUF1730 domain-containing protein [Clostridia bacterium]